MRHITTLLGLCVLAALVGCNGSNSREPDPGPPPVEWSTDMQAVADGHNRFTIDLYAKMRAKEKGNIIFSPYSVHTALAMTATGAKGNTRDEMVKTLHLPAGSNDKMLASGDIGRYYGHPRKAFELSVANALWGQKGLPWRAEWLKEQNERFGAGFNEADFAKNPDAERERINKWVEEKTRDRIKDLLQKGQIAKDTTMVLTNAIYFKGKWATQFKPENTRKEKFKCDDDTTVEVPTMHASVKCGTAGVDGVAMVELPYQGDELSMVVVLPKKGEKLSELEKKLTPELVAKWFGELKQHNELDVSLPKFKIESRYELPDYLQALGMKDAFDRDRADFTGMASERPGYISDVTHKAFVDVNEEGTEAAAATAVGIKATAAQLPFRADRPFLFFIRDMKHGTILFMGRVEKP
jgi:serpin B